MVAEEYAAMMGAYNTMEPRTGKALQSQVPAPNTIFCVFDRSPLGFEVWGYWGYRGYQGYWLL